MPKKTLYEILGISKKASLEEIKKAYRALARKLHPDLNPNNKKAEDQFKEITAAYDLLSDKKLKERYDKGEIDETGKETAKAFNWKSHNFNKNKYSQNFYDFFNSDDHNKEDFDLFDLFKTANSKNKRTSAKSPKNKGADLSYSLKITFLEAVLGAHKRIALTNVKKLDINIPEGTHNGQILRLKGQGMPGFGKLNNGDALIEIIVEEHTFFELKGHNIHLDVPVTIKEAELGAKIMVPTITGKISVSIPPKSNTDTILRIKGKGVTVDHKTGDQLIRLKVVLPEGKDPAFEKFVKEWKPVHNQDPRTRAGII